ncbi:hypothetical protein [Paracoccus sp. (in: a-proteobacteria)]|uniref:hypothetical protein n=1 Tax=Paracoccus sp. TaxID=267 RepID=UPI003A864425
MKFSTRVDTDLSAADLFAMVSDFGRIERILLRHGAHVSRSDSKPQVEIGSAWTIRFRWHGKVRNVAFELTQLDRPERVSLAGLSEAFETRLDFTIVALSPSRSRLLFESDVKPRNMRARLLLQTAKLGKAQLDRRFERRIGLFVDELRGVV